MLGRNHALYGLAGWVGIYPVAAGAELPGFPATGNTESDLAAFGISALISAGASVLPDLDHPDAHPARYAGFLSRWFARRLSKAAGGHRMMTHTFAFAGLLAALSVAIVFLPSPFGASIAAGVSGFCVGLGVALVAPSLKIRIPSSVDLLIGVGAGYWVFREYEMLRWLLPYLAAYGVIAHILCDAVTKGGVPMFAPFTRRRFKVGLFRVGGFGEQVATVVGMTGLMVAGWRAAIVLSS